MLDSADHIITVIPLTSDRHQGICFTCGWVGAVLATYNAAAIDAFGVHNLSSPL